MKLEYFQQYRIQSCFSAILTSRAPIKKIFQHFFHVHFMERLNEISSRETNFSKCIKYQIFWTLNLQMESQVMVSRKHPFNNFKKGYS